MFQSSSERFTGAGQFLEAAHVTVVQQGDRGLVLGVIGGPLRFVALHHRHGFAAKCRAQPAELLGQVRNVRNGVLQNQRLHRLRVMDAVFDGEPATP